MNQSNSSKQVLLSVIGVAILVVAVVGVSFAFFNYTRTGGTNTLRTGQINFITTDIGGSLTNLFPISAGSITNATISNVTDQVYVASVRIQGDTSYANGMDYTVYIDELDFDTVVGGNHVKLPISLDVLATDGLGAVADSDTYAAATETSALGAVSAHTVHTYDYKGTNAGTAVANTVLARGYIAPGSINSNTNAYTAGGVDGYIYVRAYIDSANVFITDTLTDGPVVASGYTNGTTLPSGTTQFTTSQWNSLAAGTNGATFTIRVEANPAEART